jgi:hypothetical protein
MNRRIILALVVAALTAACGPLPPQTTASPSPRPPASATPAPAPLVLPDRIVITNSSLSLTVEDPAASLARLETLVTEAGGFVSSASSWSDPQSGYAGLSAKVPPEALADLRREAIALAGGVTNSSTYSQNVTVEAQALRDRLALIDASEARLLEILLGTNDPDLAQSYVLIAELFQQERQNARNQLRSYLDSSAMASFDVSLNMPPPAMRLDIMPTPTPYLE